MGLQQRAYAAVALAAELGRRARFHLRQSPGLAALSVFIGIALWVVVTEDENPTRVDVVPLPITIEAVNIGSQFAVANTLPALRVRVAAPEDRWARMEATSFRAFVDLNGVEAREQALPVHVEVIGLSRVRVIDVAPAAVTVNLEDLVTKQVRVAAQVVGALPRGYELTGTVPDRAQVEVSGAKSLVGLVSEVIAPINVTGLTLDLDQAVVLTAVAEGGGEIRGVTVRPATARVAISVRQDTLARTLPLEVELSGQPAPGYRVTSIKVTPPSVRAEGPIDVLQGIDALPLPRVDVTGQQADMRVVARITPPEGMATAIASAVVEVTIAPIQVSVTLPVTAEVTGLRSGLAARVSPATVSVLLEGPAPKLNALPAGAVRALVDAANLNVGATDVRVTVVAPDGVTVREVQPALVSVTLTRP
jgi:YbbR domain-containing protein